MTLKNPPYPEVTESFCRVPSIVFVLRLHVVNTNPPVSVLVRFFFFKAFFKETCTLKIGSEKRH